MKGQTMKTKQTGAGTGTKTTKTTGAGLTGSPRTMKAHHSGTVAGYMTDQQHSVQVAING